MSTSESASVVAAVVAVMGDVQSVGKDGRNNQQGYSFRGIDAVVNAVGPALRKHGVVVVPLVEDVTYRDVEVGQKRTPMRECTVRVRYVFYGPAGDTIEVVAAGEAMDSGDKATPKAMSVAFRVALLQALCIPTDEPDADAHTYERAGRRSGPSPRALALFEAITNAPTAAALKVQYDQIHPALGEGEISEGEAKQLAAHVKKRKAELEQAGSAPVEPGEAGTPPGVVEKQHRRMHALWRDLRMDGDANRDARLKRTSQVVGRPVESSADLTFAEADRVIAWQEQAKRELSDVGVRS